MPLPESVPLEGAVKNGNGAGVGAVFADDEENSVMALLSRALRFSFALVAAAVWLEVGYFKGALCDEPASAPAGTNRAAATTAETANIVLCIAILLFNPL